MQESRLNSGKVASGTNNVKPAPAVQVLVSADGSWRSYIGSVIPPFILVTGLFFTGLAAYYFSRNSETNDLNRFLIEVQLLRSSIESQTGTYLALLQASRGFFYANRNADRADFTTYIRYLEIRKHYSGLQGIGFVSRVSPENRSLLEKGLREEGVTGFQIYPSGEREEYNVVILMEPDDDRNRAVLGYDMFSEPVRRSALERARDEGSFALTGRVILKQEIDANKQSGFIIYLPVYETLTEPTTIEARRRFINGYVYSPFRADDFFQSALSGRLAKNLSVAIYDGAEANSESLLYQSQPADKSVSRFMTQESIPVAGRTWTMRVSSLPSFASDSQRAWLPILCFSGTAFSFLVFAVFLSHARAREAAELRAKALRIAEQAQSELLAIEQLARETAEAANRAKDEFLAAVTHELRTPLNAIVGWAKMMRSGNLSPEIRERATMVIERNAQAQLRLTEDLLDFVGLHTNNLTLLRNPVAVQDLVTAAIATVQIATEAKNVKLLEETDENAGILFVDAVRVQQVLWNLLANAIKFTPSGGIICLITHRYPNFLQFIVRDNGEGIEKEFLSHVFDRFSQEDVTTTRRPGGLGLGLAIVRDLVELHGGTIEVLSDGKGMGASFTVKLPLNAPEQVNGLSQG